MKLFKLFESRELNSELLWYQRYITEHDLKTQMEIEDNKIVFRVGKKLIKWDAAEARQIRTVTLTDGGSAFYYALKILEGKFKRFELVEPVISKNSLYSYRYAKDVINGRFELGEPAISKDAHHSYYYAKEILKGPFKLGEPAIAKSPQYSSLYYAKFVPRKSFEPSK